ncbi:MAG: toll/interleukin-1 receptor domain-containing protein [Pseudomonadota bacterium]
MVIDKTTKWDIFVSHSSRDKPLVERIVKDFQNAGLLVWHDSKAIEPGDRLREMINLGIRNSSVVVIIISVNSMRSRWVLNELDAAMLREITEARKVVLPVAIGRVQFEDLPEDLKGKHIVDLRYDFNRKYLENGPRLVRAAQEAAGRSTIPLRDEIEVGPAAIAHFLNYEFTWRNEDARIPLKDLNTIAEAFWTSISEPSDDDLEEASEQQETFDWFVKAYGITAVHKIFLYFIDNFDFSLTRRFTDEDVAKLFNFISVFINCMKIQDVVQDLGGFNLIYMGVTPDGSFGYRLSPGVTVQVNEDPEFKGTVDDD